MTPLTSFLRYVLPLARTAAEPVAINALRQAATEFLDRSHIWVEELDPMTGVAGVADYDLEPPSKSRVAQVLAVSYDGVLLDPRALDDLDRQNRNRDWVAISGTPAAYTQLNDDQIRLVPYPEVTKSDAIRIRAALSLTPDATHVPDDLYTSYAQDIAFGAAARMMMEGGREYFDANMGIMYAKRFNAAATLARIGGHRSRVRSSLSVVKVRV